MQRSLAAQLNYMGMQVQASLVVALGLPFSTLEIGSSPTSFVGGRMSSVPLLIAIVALQANPSSTNAQAADLKSLVTHLRSEWRSYKEKAQFQQGSRTVRTMDPTTGNGTLTKQRYLVRDDCRLAVRETFKIVPAASEEFLEGEVHGLNTHYAFTLQRNKATGDWVKAGCVPRKDGVPSLVGDMFILEPQRTKPILLSAGAHSLSELIESQSSQVVSLRPLGNATLTNGLWELKLTANLTSAQAARATAITAVLDAGAKWCVKEASVIDDTTIQGKVHRSTQTVGNAYRSEEGVPIPEVTTVQREVLSPKGKQAVRTTCEFAYSIPKSPPEMAEFTMSAFGLMEPFGVDPPPQPTPWFLYAGVGAGLIILLIILLGVWQRRLARGAS